MEPEIITYGRNFIADYSEKEFRESLISAFNDHGGLIMLCLTVILMDKNFLLPVQPERLMQDCCTTTKM